MDPDVRIEEDFPAFFGQSKASILIENPSEAPRLGMIGDSFFTTLQTTARYAGEFDYAIRMADGIFGDDWNGTHILDFGNAGCLSGIKLYFKGYRNVTVADEPSLFMDFLRFLVDKYGIPIEFKTVAELFAQAVEPFQYVICQPGLSEHGHPLTVLKQLKRLMSSAGFIYFGQLVNCHPTFSPSRHLQTLHQHGLTEAWDCPGGEYRGFQRCV